MKLKFNYLYLFIFMSLGISFALSPVRAQQNSFADLDAESYRLYMDGNWEGVKKSVEKAFDLGFDTYYLRLRLAYACFYTENYRAAAGEFREALRFSPDDKKTAQMLVLSLRYAGLSNDAALAARQYQLEESFLISSASVFSSYTNYQHNSLPKMGSDYAYREATQPQNKYVLNANLSINPLSWLSLSGSYTYLQSNVDQTVNYNEMSDVIISQHDYDWGFVRHFEFPYTVANETFKGKIKQNETYLKAAVKTGNNWTVKAAVNLVSLKLRLTEAQVEYQNHADTFLYVKTTDSVGLLDYETYNYSFQTGVLNQSEQVFFIGVDRDFEKFKVSLNAGKSNFLGSDQYQTAMYLSWFPEGNMNFFLRLGGILHFEDGVTDLITDNLISFSLSPRVWTSAWLQAGKIKNTVFNEGSLVFNLPDEMPLRAGTGISLLLGKHLMLQANYIFEQKKLNYRTVNLEKEINFVEQDFSAHTFSGGIIWKF